MNVNSIPAETPKKSRATAIYLAAACVISLAAALIQLALMYNFYELNTHLYLAETSLPLFYHIALAALTAALATSFFTADKSVTELPQTGTVSVFFSSMTGFMLFARTVMHFVGYFGGTASTKWETASAVLALPAALYFFFTAAGSVRRRRLSVLFGYFVVVWGAVTLMCSHFDKTTPLNSPLRIQNQLALICIMLYMLYELRFSLGIPKPRLYVLFACVAVPLVAVPAVCAAVFTLAGYYVLPAGLFQATAELSFAFYIACRAFSLCFPKKVKETVPEEAANTESETAPEDAAEAKSETAKEDAPGAESENGGKTE